MSRGFVAGLMDDMQQQNARLKNDLIALRKQFNVYETEMMRQLQTIDGTKVIYDTPEACLEVFARQFARIKSEEQQYKASIRELTQGNALLKQQEKEHQERYQAKVDQLLNAESLHEQKTKSIRQSLAEAERKYSESQDDLIKQQEYHEQHVQLLQEKFKIKLNEEGEILRAASLKEKQAERAQGENALAKAMENVRVKDEQLKEMAKGLAKITSKQKMGQVETEGLRNLIKDVAHIDGLHSNIAALNQEIHSLKKELGEVINKKVSFEISNNELKSTLAAVRAKLLKKEQENSRLESTLKATAEELAESKKTNQNLQRYYDLKWNREFEKVKTHLEKVYEQRARQQKQQFEQSKQAVQDKIDYYVQIYQKNLKDIESLKEHIVQLHQQLAGQAMVISQNNHARQEQARREREQQLMSVEFERSLAVEMQFRMAQTSDTIARLQEQVHTLSDHGQIFEKKMSEAMKEIRAEHEKQISALNISNQKKVQRIQRDAQTMNQKMIKSCDERIAAQKAVNERIEQKHQKEIQDLNAKMSKKVAGHMEQLEEERQHWKEEFRYLESKERIARKELEDLGDKHKLQLTDLTRELEIRQKAFRIESEKVSNDEHIKRELKALVDSKAAEVQVLLRQKEEAKVESEAKDSQIMYMQGEVRRLHLTRQQWEQIIDETRQECVGELQQMNALHENAMQLMRSKVWELESFLSSRPIRPEDFRVIRSLSEKKKELMTKMDLKEAQNLILRQLNHYYEQRADEGLSLTTSTPFKKPKPLAHIITAKRPKRIKVGQSTVFKPQKDETETIRDIKRMRKYLVDRSRQRKFHADKVQKYSSLSHIDPQPQPFADK